MTEAEWLACRDPAVLLIWLGTRITPRKWRALLLACCRAYPGANLADLGPALEAAERHIDGELPPAEAARWVEAVSRIKDQRVGVRAIGGQWESGVSSNHEETHRWPVPARSTRRSSSSRPFR